ncbi:hypothetical protein [Chondromyces crocatus]|uniref:Uncharacterized protein n=1 Tax=Chondromyces crocatus TaxID=52 RepID=A0A0K1E828_CHOCO|nr:hypothetical protein [Chondromyces crocatus]AKT36723.1 uncharacterized protein CMC5_008440 [Chondromyces crocatus]
MRGIEFHETMTGSYHLVTSPHAERPMSFTVRARTHGGLRGLLGRPEAEIEGEIDAEGLAEHRYLKGRLALDVLRTGKLVYDFQFEDDAGRPCRFAGEKTVRLDDLVETMTVLPGKLVLQGDGGEEIGQALLRFDLRGDLIRFLRSFRVVR